MSKRTWHINYKGWRICHDPLGHLACYPIESEMLCWFYFGGTVAEIKRAIDEWIYTASLTAEEVSRVGEDGRAEEGA